MRLDGAQDPVGWYGYNNDAPSPDDAALPQMVATPARRTRRRRPSPTRTPTSSSRGQTGADPTYDYGTHFLFQGHEVGGLVDGAERYITRINLDADAAHRVTLLATTDSTGAADRRDRRLDLGSVGAAAAVHDGERAAPDVRGDGRAIPSTVDRRLRRARPRRLRGHPGRLRRQHLDRRGHRRRRASQGTTAKRPNSFVYRYVPRQPGDLDARQAAGAAGHGTHGQPVTFDVAGARSTRPTRSLSTPTASRSTRTG